MMKSVLISEDQSKALLQYIVHNAITYQYVQRKNQLICEEKGLDVLKFRLPISIDSPTSYPHIPNNRANYVLIMIRSGVASVGYFEDGININHKVFRAYMVRKKQGMSQIKYLKTRGKSRAGSRVRLAETEMFFQKINQRLRDCFKEYHVDRIGLSCPVTLIPYLYRAKTSPPFKKDDPRILKIPKHVQHPTYQSLLDINEYLLQGEIQYTEEGKALKNLFLATLALKKNDQSAEENW